MYKNLDCQGISTPAASKCQERGRVSPQFGLQPCLRKAKEGRRSAPSQVDLTPLAISAAFPRTEAQPDQFAPGEDRPRRTRGKAVGKSKGVAATTTDFTLFLLLKRCEKACSISGDELGTLAKVIGASTPKFKRRRSQFFRRMVRRSRWLHATRGITKNFACRVLPLHGGPLPLPFTVVP